MQTLQRRRTRLSQTNLRVCFNDNCYSFKDLINLATNSFPCNVRKMSFKRSTTLNLLWIKGEYFLVCVFRNIGSYNKSFWVVISLFDLFTIYPYVMEISKSTFPSMFPVIFPHSKMSYLFKSHISQEIVNTFDILLPRKFQKRQIILQIKNCYDKN